MVPSILYKDGRKLPSNAIGASSDVRYMYVKETRAGAAVRDDAERGNG